MRIARLATEDGIEFAVDKDGEWELVSDPFQGPITMKGQRVSRDRARLLAPTVPRVILGMAHNGSPESRPIPPQAFAKSARSVAGPGDVIRIDPQLGRIVVEGELAVVIGKPAKALTLDNALDAVLGFTIGNDVSATDQSALDSFWTQTKNGDNFTPLGPWIETDVNPFDAHVRLTVNGKVVAEASTAQLARNVAEVLVYVTRYVTLGPGDVILSGCPNVLSPVEAGDTFEIEIAGVGTLSNSAASL